jgi:epoxyqueuosine reductase
MEYTTKDGLRSFGADIRRITNSIVDKKHIKIGQPKLNKAYVSSSFDPVLNEQWFLETITEKVAIHPLNSMRYAFAGERIFEEPLVGFARGDDAIFEDYKRIIGPYHLTPHEIMSWQAAKNGAMPPPASEISVVSYILPHSEKARKDNAARNDRASERWAQSKYFGEAFSMAMVAEIIIYLMQRGILAVAPELAPRFRKDRYQRVGLASTWSQRHIAYAAGLGTFGLNCLLITEKGSAHRCGSLVVNLKLAPNRVRPENIHADCLQYNGIKCGKCARRCPVKAIGESDKDKEACYRNETRSYSYCKKNYNVPIYICGLCSTGIPCESKIPVKQPTLKNPEK